MPGKHAPASSRSFALSLTRALGAALGAVGLMVAAVLVLLSRGGDEPTGLPVVSPRPSASVSARATATSPSPTPSPTKTATVLPPNRVTVQVLNGTARTGLARRTAADIEAEGYKILGTGNAARIAKSTIFYRRGSRAEALAFQQAFPQFTVLKESTETGEALLRVVIGADFP